MVAYTLLNFTVNFCDYLIFVKILKYEEQLDQSSLLFSYQIFQIGLCLLIALVYSQTLSPTVPTIKEQPWILSPLFRLSIPLNFLMLVSVLYELTFYNQHQRTLIFKQSLARVFITLISVYFIAIVFSHWI